MHVRAIDVHDELLIASSAVARRLIDQASPVAAEIRFRILTTKGELPDVLEVALSGLTRDNGCG
jgi:hypothetical protein